jgi:hypothetical protein
MRVFLEKWAGAGIEVATDGDGSQPAELKPEPLHYALTGKALLGEPTLEPCEVGCGARVKFYRQEGVAYGYCMGCGVHQRIIEMLRRN